jgi:hypothetical protein
MERRKITQRGDKAVPQARLEALFADDRNGLRERVLWRMLYDTAARAEEILSLNIGDLDPEFRRARTRSKGGDLEYLHWATATAARLLPRLLVGRTEGPVFLADRRSPAAGKRARALADIDPATGRGRLSYPRAEYLFKQASLFHDPHGTGWTLHQLRHSALKHLAASGRTAPELQAKSRHSQTAGHPRALRPPGRGDVRPHHRRQRSSRPPTAPLNWANGLACTWCLLPYRHPLTRATLARTTFCYPDSVFEPTRFGVASRMELIALAEADDKDLLDDYIEAQVHGPLLLAHDVEALVLDPCFRGTDVERRLARISTTDHDGRPDY